MAEHPLNFAAIFFQNTVSSTGKNAFFLPFIRLFFPPAKIHAAISAFLSLSLPLSIDLLPCDRTRITSPDTCRFSSLFDPFHTAVTFFHLSCFIKVDHLKRTDCLTTSAAIAKVLIYENKTCRFFPVNCVLRADMLTFSTVNAPWTHCFFKCP